MSSSLRALLPYRHLLDEDKGSPLLAKAQALVSSDDKRTILASLGGDDGVFTFLIQTTFKRTADFIREHHLNTYDSANYARIVAFIRDGADTHAPGTAVTHSDAGPTTSSQPTPSVPPSVAPVSRQVNPRRNRIVDSYKRINEGKEVS